MSNENSFGKRPSPPLKLPDVFNYDFDNPHQEKKWAKKTADVTDYFNYGLNEETFKAYAAKIRKLFRRLNDKEYTPKVPENPLDKNNVLDSTLPITHGGFGEINIETLRSHMDYGDFLNEIDPSDWLEYLIPSNPSAFGNDPYGEHAKYLDHLKTSTKRDLLTLAENIPDIYSQHDRGLPDGQPPPGPNKLGKKPEPPPKFPEAFPRPPFTANPMYPGMPGYPVYPSYPQPQMGPMVGMPGGYYPQHPGMYQRPPAYMAKRPQIPMGRMQPPQGGMMNPLPPRTEGGAMHMGMRPGMGSGNERPTYEEFGEDPHKKVKTQQGTGTELRGEVDDSRAEIKNSNNSTNMSSFSQYDNPTEEDATSQPDPKKAQASNMNYIKRILQNNLPSVSRK